MLIILNCSLLLQRLRYLQERLKARYHPSFHECCSMIFAISCSKISVSSFFFLHIPCMKRFKQENVEKTDICYVIIFCQ